MPKFTPAVQELENTFSERQTGPFVDRGGSVGFDARAYGAVLDGTTDDGNALADAITAAQVSGIKVVTVAGGTALVGSDLTVPAGITLHPLEGAMIKPASGVTVTIEGYVPPVEYQWIDESLGGRVLYAGPGRSKPVWYGAGTVRALDWRNLSRPAYIAHRGFPIAAPENTLIGNDVAIAYGGKIIKTDVWLTADGYLVVNHDSTLARTYNKSWEIKDKTLSEILTAQNLATDYTTLPPPLVTQILDHPRNILWQIECKTTTLAAVKQLCGLIVDRGLQHQVQVAVNTGVGPAFVENVLADFPSVRMVGIEQLSPTPPDLDAWAAAGLIGINVAKEASYLDASFVTAARSKGLAIGVFGVNSREARDVALSYDVDIISTDHFAWVAGDITQQSLPVSDDFQRQVWGVWWAGMLVANWDVGGGSVGVNATDKRDAATFIGAQLPDDGSTVRIEVTYTPTKLNADNTRWAGLQFCMQNDQATHTYTPLPNYYGGGYNAFIRQNGAMQLARLVPGVNSSPLATTTGTPAMEVGTEIPLRLDISPTDITLTRTDTGDSVTAADATYRGGYVAFIVTNTGGQFSDFSITTV